MSVGEMPSSVVDQSGTIVTDVACRKCSYNLRGLTATGSCPECGTPAGLSIHGDLLRFADPQWVGNLEKGVTLILWGIVAAIVGGVIGILLGSTLHPMLGKLIALAGQGVSLYGAWLLTEPDPSGLNEGQHVTARKIVRVALIVGLVYSVLDIGVNSGTIGGGLLMVFGGLSIVAGLIGVVGEFARLYYLEMLARRVPDLPLAARTNTIRWGYGVCLAIMVVLGAIITLSVAVGGVQGGGGGGGGIMALGCVAGIVGIVFLVYGIMYLLALFKYRIAFAEQAAHSRAIWAAATAEQPL